MKLSTREEMRVNWYREIWNIVGTFFTTSGCLAGIEKKITTFDKFFETNNRIITSVGIYKKFRNLEKFITRRIFLVVFAAFWHRNFADFEMSSKIRKSLKITEILFLYCFYFCTTFKNKTNTNFTPPKSNWNHVVLNSRYMH